MHNDEPALLDTLERGSLIEEVGKAIAGCEPPQVFGVHGDWGLGKTSFLHQVQWYLTGDCPQQPEAITNKMNPNADAANGMAVSVGRIRPAPPPHDVAFVVVAHNGVRGAAGACIANAELHVARHGVNRAGPVHGLPGVAAGTGAP